MMFNKEEGWRTGRTHNINTIIHRMRTCSYFRCVPISAHYVSLVRLILFRIFVPFGFSQPCGINENQRNLGFTYKPIHNSCRIQLAVIHVPCARFLSAVLVCKWQGIVMTPKPYEAQTVTVADCGLH